MSTKVEVGIGPVSTKVEVGMDRIYKVEVCIEPCY